DVALEGPVVGAGHQIGVLPVGVHHRAQGGGVQVRPEATAFADELGDLGTLVGWDKARGDLPQGAGEQELQGLLFQLLGACRQFSDASFTVQGVGVHDGQECDLFPHVLEQGGHRVGDLPTEGPTEQVVGAPGLDGTDPVQVVGGQLVQVGGKAVTSPQAG